jgi:hypothetical protein
MADAPVPPPEPVEDPFEEEDDEETEDEDEEESDEAKAPKPATVGRNYTPLPDGVVTLVGFSKLLQQKPPVGRFVDVKSQVFYSTAKNTKSFPAYQHTDGRWVINIDDGLKWWDGKEQRKVDRVANAQAKPVAEEETDEDEVEAS